LISTVRASLAPVPLSGLADQTMLPDVVEPTPLVEALLGLVVPLLLVPLLPQALSTSTALPARATSPTPLLGQ
jgi:predicted benzoate:H+ symporter BenE